MPKTDSSPPKEVDRLKRELRAKEEQAIEKRFFALEAGLKEVREMAEVEHECTKDPTFQMIKDTFASGSAEFDAIHNKIDSMSRTKFWSYIGVLTTIVMIALGAVYTYARNEANWEHTTKQVQAVEASTKSIDTNVRTLTVGFRLMDQSNKNMQKKMDGVEKKMEAVSPKKIEDAVSKGMRRGRRTN